MDIEKILEQKPYYYQYETIRDIIQDCLRREQICGEKDIIDEDGIYCELYFEEHFTRYVNKSDFLFEFAKERLREIMESIFISIKATPFYLIEAVVDDYFTLGWGINENRIATQLDGYIEIITQEAYYVANTSDFTYYVDDIMDEASPLLDDDEYIKIKQKLCDYVLK